MKKVIRSTVRANVNAKEKVGPISVSPPSEYITVAEPYQTRVSPMIDLHDEQAQGPSEGILLDRDNNVSIILPE